MTKTGWERVTCLYWANSHPQYDHRGACRIRSVVGDDWKRRALYFGQLAQERQERIEG